MPSYGLATYGIDAYGTPDLLPALGSYGASAYGVGPYSGHGPGLTEAGQGAPVDYDRIPAYILRATWLLQPNLFVADIDNVLYGDALPIGSGNVHMTGDATVKWNLTADLLTDVGIDHPIAWFTPTMTVTRPVPGARNLNETITANLGLYAVIEPTEAIHRVGRDISVQGVDLRWLLSQAQFSTNFTIPKGTNVVRAAIDVIRSAGVRRVSIPPNSATLPADKTWPLNTSKLQIATDLLTGISYYAPWADRNGQVRSMPYRLLASVHPSRSISSANGDVLSDVTITPSQGTLYNQVIVVGTNLQQAPIEVVMTNVDPTSPTSIWNIAGTGAGDPIYIPKYIQDSNITTIEAAQATAQTYLDQASAMYQTIEVGVTPDPRFEVHDVWELDIVQDDGGFVADGLWWLREVTMGLVGNDPVQTVKLSRIQDISMETS